MEIKMNNMLEVCELVSALEERIEHTKTVLAGCNSLSLEALMNIYNQVKADYQAYLNFKY